MAALRVLDLLDHLHLHSGHAAAWTGVWIATNQVLHEWGWPGPADIVQSTAVLCHSGLCSKKGQPGLKDPLHGLKGDSLVN